MLNLILLIVLLNCNEIYSLKCRVVNKGQQFTSEFELPKLKDSSVISARIKFNESTANYLFLPTESRGRACTESWNAFWGTTRCGYFTSQLVDSDRFVFRRARGCVEFDSQGHVIRERAGCPDAGLVELAVSAYDDAKKPYEHMGKLLKQFSTKIYTNTWYRFQLTVEESKSTYQLSDDNEQVLEVLTVDHHSCPEVNRGWFQSLYFGGQCPAPQDISVCYD